MRNITQTPHGRAQGDCPVPSIDGVPMTGQRKPGKRMRSWVRRCIRQRVTPPVARPHQSSEVRRMRLSLPGAPVLGLSFAPSCAWSAPRAGVSYLGYGAVQHHPLARRFRLRTARGGMSCVQPTGRYRATPGVARRPGPGALVRNARRQTVSIPYKLSSTVQTGHCSAR